MFRHRLPRTHAGGGRDLRGAATLAGGARHRRFGFHGLAHEWAARRAAELLDRPMGELRTVVAHLGSASACAVHGGVSVDTTMGFTPTAGLVMGTRCGDLDPAVPLWLVQHAGLGAGEVADALDRGSGLHGPMTITDGFDHSTDDHAALVSAQAVPAMEHAEVVQATASPA